MSWSPDHFLFVGFVGMHSVDRDRRMGEFPIYTIGETVGAGAIQEESKHTHGHQEL